MSRRRQRRAKWIKPGGWRYVALVAGIATALLLVGLAMVFRRLFLPGIDSLDEFLTVVLASFVDAAAVPSVKHFLSGALLLLGGYLLLVAVKRGIQILNPSFEGKSMGAMMRQRQLAAGPNIVVIGGGTGLSTLLRGIKHKTSRITAIVTVTDDGGSSGRLVTDKGILPPGDIRNCLVALADAEKTMTDLFQHRFEGASGRLSGHSVGNLLIAAMTDITGDFDRAIGELGRVLAIRGRVLPATLDHVKLRAEMEDGTFVCGETQIVNSRLRIRRIFLEPGFVTPLEEVLQAIAEADTIVIGPGSVYTSLIPPLLVPGIADAVAKCDAARIYVCNVMTQPGETETFTASDHVRAIETNVGRRVFDTVLINKARPGQYLLERYARVGQDFIEPDADRVRAMGLRAVSANLISETDLVRHDPMRIADAIMRIAP